MTQIEIAEKIIPFLAEEFEIEATLIKPEANMRETLQLDSLDYIDLVVVIESNFSFKVELGDFQNLITFNDFYSYVDSKINTSHESITKQ
ncbi:MAG: phosphopantetheine-binding protein [Bacteroidota bacterium]